MLDLGLVVCLTFAGAGVGLKLLDRLGGRPTPWIDAIALAVTLGLGTMALAALGLGELGGLNRWGFGVLLVAGALCHFPLRPARLQFPRRLNVGHAPDLAIALTLAVTILGTLLTALAPVTDGDALCYHLQVPKVFLAQGAVGFEPDLHETIYPLTTELLFAFALAFRGPVACRLISWVLGLAFAANVTALARPSLGSRAWWAGAIALLVPAVSNGMSAPLNDVALAAFGTSAIVAWARFHEEPTPRRAALVGLLAGFALGVKYPALVLTGLLAPALAASALRNSSPRQQAAPASRFKNAMIATLVFGVVTLLVGGPWYLRAWIHTGNPVYPFFRHHFGGAGLDEVLDPVKRPLTVSLANLLPALGPLTLEPDRFDSFSHQFGPVFLLYLPGLLLNRPPRRVLAIVGLGYAFLMLCLTQRQSMRFVLIAIGPMAVGVAWLAQQFWERRSLPGRTVVVLLWVALGFESSLALARVRHGLPILLGREDAVGYLSRCEPTFRVGRWIDDHLPAEARIIGQDHRGFYLPRPYTMELAYRRRTGLGRDPGPAVDVVDRLRREGFTHMLLCPPIPEDAVEFDPTLGRLIAPWLAGHRPAFSEKLADSDGVYRHYAIYAIGESRVATGAIQEDRRARR